ncbi:NADH dehydrogenase [ubiquinone] iron-sulfur protein 5 [Cephus cinctus]|uniref:NADH dehydrogenase [ubiquinone] iron-sulfur protein 5 n=1 Tax=Cephus cinctus TaxID=211228 RepID=A0AAJ7R815_CEPCN|nr:NADH dehydrogenase [ubiquinone] iron-sulfur protein 5 [Cephus cinctus]
MPISPIFRNPLTDLSGGLLTFENTECEDRELKAIECVEAYGLPKGEEKCKILITDFKECITKFKSFTRVAIMRNERLRQYRAGQREEQFEELPRFDAV